MTTTEVTNIKIITYRLEIEAKILFGKFDKTEDLESCWVLCCAPYSADSVFIESISLSVVRKQYFKFKQMHPKETYRVLKIIHETDKLTRLYEVVNMESLQ